MKVKLKRIIKKNNCSEIVESQKKIIDFVNIFPYKLLFLRTDFRTLSST